MKLDLDQLPMITRPAYSVDIPWANLETALAEYYSGKCYVLDLDPDFQRGLVWTKAQKVAYVEFCLRGGTYGRELHFNAPGWPEVHGDVTIELVDGKQRLDAVRRFIADDLEVFGGWKHSEMPTRMARRVFQRFHFSINGLGTRAEVLQWYLDIIAGGSPHSPDEIERVRALLVEERAKS